MDQRNKPGCASYGLLMLAGAWVLLVAAATQLPPTIIDSLQLTSGPGLPGRTWVLVTWGYALLLAAVLALLAWQTRSPQLRAVYRTWALAAGCVFILAGSRAFGALQLHSANVAQAVLSVVCAAAIYFWPGGWKSRRRPASAGWQWSASAALAAIVLLPPLRWGALGSRADTLLGLLAGLSFGLLAGLLLDRSLMTPLMAATAAGNSSRLARGRRALLIFGAGTTLFILGGGFGIRGNQLLLLIALPPLGLLATALHAWGQSYREAAPTGGATGMLRPGGEGSGREPDETLAAPGSGALAPQSVAGAGPRAGVWGPAALLIGLVTAGFLIFWDPAELTGLLFSDEVVTWALRAAEGSLLLATAGGLVAWAVYDRLARRDRSSSTARSGRGLPAGEPVAEAVEGPLESPAGGMPVGSPDQGRQQEAQGGAPGAARPPTRQAGPARGPALWWALAALLAWAGAAAVYGGAGQAGLYGDRMFVIFRDQADVSPAYQVADRAQRLHYVYTTLTEHARTSQAGLRAWLSQRGAGYRPYYLVNALEVDDDPLLRRQLTGRPEIDRIIYSQRLRPLPRPLPASRGSAPAPAGTLWNIALIGADRVWHELGVTGQGIVIGQSDSGVDGDHPAVSEAYRGRDGQDDYNWLDPWNGTRQPADIGGHGTHTLATIVGRDGIGVAPGAQWMACVNLARDLGSPGAYLDCMQFMLAPYPQHGDPFNDGDTTRAAHILNNSWGCPPVEGCDPGALAPATAALRAAGIFVVVSAGNAGPACSTVNDPLALYGDVLSVGAIDRQAVLTDFSSRGPVTADGSNRTKPDILAPGEDVLSAFPGRSYATLAGTSMAGPHVAGVVALMWSAQPKLIGDIDRTTQILRQTAQPYAGVLDDCAGQGRPNNDAGYGVVDAYAAVKAALEGK